VWSKSPIFALLAVCAAVPIRAQVVIDEIHYEPLDETRLEEFLELTNAGGEAEDLSGWYFSEGISYRFPAGTTLAPGEFLVVAEDPAALTARYGAFRVVGPFTGHLSNDGERVVHRNARGGKEDEVDYGVGFPWPSASAGDGGSMELIDPLLPNDVGGSWRAASMSGLPTDPVIIVPSQDVGWHYRKGTSEASSPTSAWRALDFVEDATWSDGQTSIGYGDDDDMTTLDDMLSGYTSVYLRRVFTIADAEDIPTFLRLRIYVDDGCIVWLNGVEVARSNVDIADPACNATGINHEMVWEDFDIDDPRSILTAGDNVLAIHAFNTRIDSSDFSIDAELLLPGQSAVPGEPSPGRQNSVHADHAPPLVRQVNSIPLEPPSGQPFLVTAKVTDPDGVASVFLDYQVVLPGSYIPARLALEPSALMANPTKEPPANPAFSDPTSWTPLAMADDGTGGDQLAGDGIYTATIPAQVNRALVRWRITATDALDEPVKVPYPDDPSLNFACFVYDGVPPYTITRATVHPGGAIGYTYPAAVMDSIPVYHLITRNYDLVRCLAYDGSWQLSKGNEAARDAFNWEGTFVYEGVVYDHIRYRLRQANDRYHGGGKRSWRVRFNRGNRLRARDNEGREYPTRWRHLNIGKMFDNLSVGNFGLTESLNAILWNLTGVPAPYTHTFHFRVVDGPDEAPAGTNGQHYGDFWGIALAMEDYSPGFVDAHGLPDGNLYKLKDGIFDGKQLRRNQGRYSITTDADFQNIRANLRPERDAAWLDSHVRYDAWYPYHAVVEGIRHYDFVPADSHSKNRAWFFEPAPDLQAADKYGLLWTLPWDSDASWGPNWNSGIDYSYNAIYASGGKPAYKIAYRSVLREFRDLIWRTEIVNPEIDRLAAIIKELAMADRDRWRGAPADAGSQDWGTMEAKVQDMKNFAFVGWSGGSGPTVPAGGRAKYLEDLANAESDSTMIPATPVISRLGASYFPIDDLVFGVSPFSDPQGAATFSLLRWRVSEVTESGLPERDAEGHWISEWSPVWEVDLESADPSVTIPLGPVLPGRFYTIRARAMDNTGRWSHWSQPIEFLADQPDSSLPQQRYLRVTELMYNPADGGDDEFIEIQNIGPVALDIAQVRLGGGIEFSFAGGAVTSLGPGEYLVVVKDLGAFGAVYDPAGIRIAGEYGGRLDNGGDTVALFFGDGLPIQTFAYDDAWYPETDGLGRSLVIADTAQGLALWSAKEGWKPSADPGGSPGAPDSGAPPAGRNLPGDLNGDLRLDLSDAIGLLLHLFGGEAASLPCGGTLDAGGDLALLDATGEGEVDLADPIRILDYLFLSGPPHVLGEACAPITGCPERCGS
jgi:hypothetical protein